MGAAVMEAEAMGAAVTAAAVMEVTGAMEAMGAGMEATEAGMEATEAGMVATEGGMGMAAGMDMEAGMAIIIIMATMAQATAIGVGAMGGMILTSMTIPLIMILLPLITILVPLQSISIIRVIRQQIILLTEVGITTLMQGMGIINRAISKRAAKHHRLEQLRHTKARMLIGA